MLFSNKPVVDFINDHFEPAWESLRPVPVVTIDFGRGKLVTRTLGGNIATWVCNEEGDVLDVLPGIYAPEAYRQQLDKMVQVFRFAMQADVGLYHKKSAEILDRDPVPERLARREIEVGAGASILGTEKKVKVALSPGHVPTKPVKLAVQTEQEAWNLLAEDTLINEKVRRRKIHQMLGETGAVPVEPLVKKVFKDVLATDLEDPYLGLGKVLSGE